MRGCRGVRGYGWGADRTGANPTDSGQKSDGETSWKVAEDEESCVREPGAVGDVPRLRHKGAQQWGPHSHLPPPAAGEREQAMKG